MKTVEEPLRTEIVEVGFGYTYYAHMIPPSKPEHTLILGYGKGIVPDLMRKVWGPCKITAVDFRFSSEAYQEYDLTAMEARNFVKQCTDGLIKTRFDYIAIDLWNGRDVCEFIYDSNFANRIKQMVKDKLCINQPMNDFERLKPYFEAGFTYDRFVQVYGNRVSWWSVSE